MAARNELDLLVRQLRAVEAWHLGPGAALRAQEVAGVSRETRLDLSRRMDVLRAQHQAIVARAHAQLSASAHPLADPPATRAVLVHRNEWFRDKVCAGLVAQGVDVVARLTNGAEAIGCVVAEQPELLLVEDVLAMLSGAEVVREVRELAPRTRIGAQVENERLVVELLDAGAHEAWTRRVTPDVVTDGLLGLLQAELQHS